MFAFIMISTEELVDKQIADSKQGYKTSNDQIIPPWWESFTKYLDNYIYPELDELAAYSVKMFCSQYFNSFSVLLND